MKIQILLCFILVLISNATARTLTRNHRQIDSEEISNETNLQSDRWGWSWGEIDDDTPTKTTRRPSSTTSTTRTTTRSTTISSATDSSSSIRPSSTSTPITSSSIPITSSSIPITSSSIPITSSSTPITSSSRPIISSSTPTISSSSASPIVTPNPAIFNRCMASCMRTPEYNPLCAILDSNGMRKQYGNEGEMNCANFCGESSRFLFRGSCAAFF